jgi:hypothetical protein
MKLSQLVQNRWLRLSFLLLVVGLGCAGCGTTDAENTSARPWNSPEGWQNGNLPSSMTQPR